LERVGGSGGDASNMLPWAAEVVAKHRAANGAEDFEARCLPGGPPRAAPYHTALFATPKVVLMLFEGNTHMYRQFFVDGSDHPKDLKPTFYGDSRGALGRRLARRRYRELLREILVRLRRTPHTKQMHLTEKFHRIDYGNMEMQVITDDPGVLTKPWVIDRRTTLEPNFEMTEYVCNENNQDPEHLDATLKDAPGAKNGLDKSKGVPSPQARKAPAPPAGAAPRTADGKVDFSACGFRQARRCQAILRIEPAFRRSLTNESDSSKGCRNDSFRIAFAEFAFSSKSF